MEENTITIPPPPEGFVDIPQIPDPPLEYGDYISMDEFEQFQMEEPDFMEDFWKHTGQGAWEIPKGLTRGTEQVAAFPGKFVRWMAEKATTEGGMFAGDILLTMPGANVLAEHAIRKYGPHKKFKFYNDLMRLNAKHGKMWADFWTEQASKGWEAPNEDVLRAKWTQRPFSKAAMTISEATPNYLAAIGLSVLTKNPRVGLGFLSGLSGAEAYEAQRNKGKSIWLADKIATMTAVWEYATEKIPFDEVFKPAKSRLLKMLKIGSMEAAQEFIQGLGENFLEHFGYNVSDIKSVPLAVREGAKHLLDNWVENVVGGLGLGIAGAGIVPNKQIQARKEELLSNPPEDSSIQEAMPEETQAAAVPEPPSPPPTVAAAPVEKQPIQIEKPKTVVQQAEEQAEKIEKEPKPLNIEKDIDEDELPSVTSARQAMIAEDRKTLGLDEMASTTRKSWQKSLSNAKKKGLDEKALRTADEVNKNPRALDDEETAGLVLKAARLKNEYSDLMAKINKADDVEMKSLSAEAEQIENEFERLSRAIHLSGTEKGRNLAAQKLTIDQDYSLISVKNRAKAAKGKALSAKESAKLAEVTNQLEQANTKIEELQRQINEMAAKRAIKERGIKRYSRMSLEQKDTELHQTVERLNELIKAGCL